MTQKQVKIVVDSNTKNKRKGLKGVTVSVNGKGPGKVMIDKILKDLANEDISTVQAYHLLIQ